MPDKDKATQPSTQFLTGLDTPASTSYPIAFTGHESFSSITDSDTLHKATSSSSSSVSGGASITDMGGTTYSSLFQIQPTAPPVTQL